MIVVKKVSVKEVTEDSLLSPKKERRYNNTSGLDAPKYITMETWLPFFRHEMRCPYEWSFELKIDELETLEKSCQLACISGQISRLFIEDLDEIVKRLEIYFPSNREWMMRLDSASTKDSPVRPPFRTARDVVYSIASSGRCYNNCFNGPKKLENIRIYFSRYDPTWNVLHEWRVFIYGGKAAAVSQYACYTKYPSEVGVDTAEVLFRYSEEVIRGYEFTELVIDLYYDPLSAEKPNVVEINNYLNSGSCLLSWGVDIFPDKFPDVVSFAIGV